MKVFIIFLPILISLYFECIYKKIKGGYEQRFKFMNLKLRIVFFINIIVFAIGFYLMIFGFYKNISTKNHFIQEGTYAEGEVINYKWDGWDLWDVTFVYEIQIERDGEKLHFYAWSNSMLDYYISDKVEFYYIADEYTENYIGVINAMIEGDNCCKSGEIALHASVYFFIAAAFIWLARYKIDLDFDGDED